MDDDAMIGYMRLEEQLERDYERARRRSLIGRLAARLRGDPGRGKLPAFEPLRRATRAENRTYLGLRTVEVSRILGSVGRSGEFDRDFMPTRASEGRWQRVDAAFHRCVDLPPVTLYEICGAYFVEDGNHRVSVARFQGVEMVEAEVTRFYPLSPACVCEAGGRGRKLAGAPGVPC